VVCGTERHPYQPLSATVAGRPERLQTNEAKPSYAIYPQSMQQRPEVEPSADFRAVYVGPCHKPVTHYGSTLRKNGDSEGKAVTVCKHGALQCSLSVKLINFCSFVCCIGVQSVLLICFDIMHE